jgi:hypothetical protein
MGGQKTIDCMQFTGLFPGLLHGNIEDCKAEVGCIKWPEY